MAKKKAAAVTIDDIGRALEGAAQDFLTRVAKKHPKETIYGFLFEISAEGFSAHGAVGTEENLERAVADLSDGNAKVAGELRAELRWRGIEDAWYQQPDSAFDAANRLLRKAEQTELYEAYDGTLEQLCFDVLKVLDGMGTFGKGAARDDMVLGVSFIGGDNSDEEFLAWAKEVNSPGVLRRLRMEMKSKTAAPRQAKSEPATPSKATKKPAKKKAVKKKAAKKVPAKRAKRKKA